MASLEERFDNLQQAFTAMKAERDGEVDESGAASLHHVSVPLKLPTFWAADPTMWFEQVEATFRNRCIKAQETKFNHVLAALQPQDITIVRDIISQRPRDPNCYDLLKNTLIKRKTSSKVQRIEEAMALGELGDQKPTELLLRIPQILNVGHEDDVGFMRWLFLHRLPKSVRLVLQSQDELSLKDLAKKADALVVPGVSSVSSIEADLKTQVEALKLEVAALKKPQSAKPAGITKPTYANRNQASHNGLCFYHDRFWAKAKKCRDGCALPKSGNAPGAR